MKKVVLDTDYFRFITKDLWDSKLLIKIMDELEFKAVMHEFVYKEELHEHSFVKQLVDNNFIEVIGYDFLTQIDSEKVEEYERLFRFAFKGLNGKDFTSSIQIKDYHKEKSNLGEIHSVILARFLNYDLLMSNDGGAKTFIETKLNIGKNNIRVVNIEETFTQLINPNNSNIKWSDIKDVVKPLKRSRYISDQEKFKRIHDLWVPEEK